MFTIDPELVIPADAQGYVTAIEFYPIYDVLGGREYTETSGGGYPVMRLAYYDTDPETVFTTTGGASDDPAEVAVKNQAKAAVNKWRVKLWDEPSPDVELVLSDDANYVTGYKITGLDANLVYDYSVNGNAAITLEAGTTEFDCNMPGVYKIRVAATETSGAGRYETVVVPFVNPVFGGKAFYDANKNYKIQETGFISGKWATYPKSWGADKVAENVSHLTKETILSTVSYRYEFLPEDYFVVNDHPYLALDMKNQLTNMGMTKSYIEGALRTINIYVVGEDEPYTYTQEWGEATGVYNTKHTVNKICINLLDVFPEIEGKTIRAFELKPYSNIDKCPQDYNTTETLDRYMYFHLYYLGFFDTPNNTDAVYGSTATGERVNSFDSISAECEKTFALGDIPTAADFTVYEVYDDGATAEIENFEVIVPSDFGLVEGAYSITIVSPRGKTATVVVTCQ